MTGLRAQVSVSGTDGLADNLVVQTFGGNDIVSAQGLANVVARVTIDTGTGDDIVAGSSNADVVLAGDGNDVVSGGRSNDIAQLGAGDDQFIWNPGDGSDTVDGEGGLDTLRFAGSGASETVKLTANAGRVRLTRDVATIVMDLDEVETIKLETFAGTDKVVINDLAGTAVSKAQIDLAGATAGTGDGAADTIDIFATNGNDTILLSTVDGTLFVHGLGPVIEIDNFEAANDRLRIFGLGGDDAIEASGVTGFGASSTAVTATTCWSAATATTR